MVDTIDAKYDTTNTKIISDGAGAALQNVDFSGTAGTISGNIMTCTFTRKLKTDGAEDYEIKAGVPFKVMGGVGTTSTNSSTFGSTTDKGTAMDVTIGTVADTSNTDSLGNLQLVGKLSLAVAAGALLN